MAKKEKHSYAEELYNHGFSQKRIAEMLEVTPQTVSGWAIYGNWAEKRAARLALRKGSEERIFALIEYSLRVMEQFTESQLKENPDELKPLDKGQIDSLSKLFSGIKGKELTFGQIVEVVTELIDSIRSVDIGLAKHLTEHTDQYLISKQKVLS